MERYLEDLLRQTQHTIKLGLENTVLAMEIFGNPHRRYRSILIAGSNGKGTTAAYIAAGLRSAGFRTGLFSSPHLVSLAERINLDGKDIDVALLKEYIDSTVTTCRRHNLELTFFELMTVVCARWFADQQCEYGVIEVGLGGRLDSTNVHPNEWSVVTTIGLEHTQILGNTAEEIAAEKLAILKPGTVLITGDATGWEKPLAKALKENSATHIDSRGEGITPDVHDALSYPFLEANFRHAVAFMRHLGIVDPAILRQMAAVRVPCRMQERTYKNRPLLLDAAHNSPAIEVIQPHVKEFIARHNQRSILVTTLLRDKELDKTVCNFWKCFDVVILTPISNPRSRTSDELFALRNHCGHEKIFMARGVGPAVKALNNFITGKSPFSVVVTGSIYLLGQILPLLEEA